MQCRVLSTSLPVSACYFKLKLFAYNSNLEGLLLQRNEFDVSMFQKPMKFFLTEQKC